MGTVARRRFGSSSLCRAPPHGGVPGRAPARSGRATARAFGAEIVIGFFGRLARPFLHALDPEDAHWLAVRMLKFAPLPAAAPDDKRLAVRAFGLNFPNPIGIAAGFDKHAGVPDALFRVGFGFVEVGTITPQPQPGNPRPRIFRLNEDAAVINRLGFNNEGHAAVA